MKKITVLLGILSIFGILLLAGCKKEQPDNTQNNQQQQTSSPKPQESTIPSNLPQESIIPSSLPQESIIPSSLPQESEALQNTELEKQSESPIEEPAKSNIPNVDNDKKTDETQVVVQASSNKEEIEKYQKEVSEIVNTINKETNKLAKADQKSKNYKKIFLNTVDAIDSGFSDLAKLEVPKGYEDVELLAVQASKKMTKAVSTYKQVLDNKKDTDKKSVKKKFEQANNTYLEAVNDLQKIVEAITTNP